MIQREKSLDLFSIYWSLLLQKIHAVLSRKFSFKGLGVLHRYSLNNSAEVGDLKKKKRKKKKKNKKKKKEAIM